MKNIKTFIIPIIVFLGSISIVSFGNTSKPGEEKGFAVLELFTSEGCSSCPPAEELVADIQRNNPDKKIYVLAFHVDYWDRQGWKDKFSDPGFSDRQRRYADWMHLESVYTPQIVINGSSEHVGSDQRAVLTSMADGLRGTENGNLMLSCKVDKDQVNVEYQAAGADKSSELVLALVEKSARTDVKAGENAGKVLSHVQIVRGLVSAPLSNKSTAIRLPADFDKKGWEIIGLVQNKKDGHISAATRVEL